MPKSKLQSAELGAIGLGGRVGGIGVVDTIETAVVLAPGVVGIGVGVGARIL